MPRKFIIQPDEIEIPSVSYFRNEWRNIPDPAARDAIAVENQYLYFHEHLLSNLKHQKPCQTMQPIPLGLSVRAGAVKSAILICASIVEAALRAHSERRKYKLKNDPHRRTFGNVLGSWQDEDKTPKPEVIGIWQHLQDLHDTRNNIHLYKAVSDGSSFYAVLESEKETLAKAKEALDVIKIIESS